MTKALQIAPARCKHSATIEEASEWREDSQHLYVYEQKLDGLRYLLQIRPNGVNGVFLTSRRISVVTKKFVEKQDKVPKIRDCRYHLALCGAIFDGEIVGGDMSSDTQHEMVSGDVDYHVWDLVYYRGHDLRDASWQVRRALLSWLSQFFPLWMHTVTPYFNPDGLIRRAAQGKIEGLIRKEVDKPYGVGWTKVKGLKTEDLIIWAAEPTKSAAWKAKGWIGALRIGQWVRVDPEKTVAINNDSLLRPGVIRVLPTGGAYCFTDFGRVSNFDNNIREELSKNFDKYVGMVVEIKYQLRLPSGKFRHPRFLRLRADKNSWECVFNRMTGRK